MDVVQGLVSVVIATYNRSNVLRFAMESVRWQTYPEREILVVGDGCTDDTADVVASFGDPAIRFYNLPDNFGEQSAPNNFGCRHARGEFIAFLNHDDLYLPRHLANAVGLLREAQADLVFARRYSVDAPEAPPSLRPPAGRCQYDPGFSVPASCWVFRRHLVDEMGPWRPAAELYNYPSQDWLFRVFKAGKTIRCTPEAGVIVVSSLVVDNTYRERRDIEQRKYYELLRINRDYVPAQAAAPDVRRAPAYKRGLALLAARRSWKSFLGTTIFLATIAAVRSVSRVIGHWAHPATVYWFVVGRGRRAVSVETLRHRRGLPDRKLTKEHSHE